MKNRELIEREILKRLETSPAWSFWSTEMLTSVLSSVEGKVCYEINIPDVDKAYSITKTEINYDRLKEILEGIIKDHHLEEGFSYLTTKECDNEDAWYSSDYPGIRGNIKIVNHVGMYFGDGIICKIQGLRSAQISEIIYSPDKKDVVLDIYKRYSDYCLEILKSGEEKERTYSITTVIVGAKGEYVGVPMTISPVVSLSSDDFLDNYNDNFPEEKIKEFLEIDRGGVVIFNGQPGCGKSTYIKSLVFRYPKTNFIVIPQYLLRNQEAFRKYLFATTPFDKTSRRIFVIEDCEKILLQREFNDPGSSSVIGDILNYTDGIFGDLTRTKFIFTFNTDLKNIDKALLRPGRLFLRYEFSPLTGKNLEKIAEKTGYKVSEKEKISGVPLSDLYCSDSMEDITSENRGHIGFNKP